MLNRKLWTGSAFVLVLAAITTYATMRGHDVRAVWLNPRLVRKVLADVATIPVDGERQVNIMLDTAFTIRLPLQGTVVRGVIYLREAIIVADGSSGRIVRVKGREDRTLKTRNASNYAEAKGISSIVRCGADRFETMDQEGQVTIWTSNLERASTERLRLRSAGSRGTSIRLVGALNCATSITWHERQFYKDEENSSSEMLIRTDFASKTQDTIAMWPSPWRGVASWAGARIRLPILWGGQSLVASSGGTIAIGLSEQPVIIRINAARGEYRTIERSALPTSITKHDRALYDSVRALVVASYPERASSLPSTGQRQSAANMPFYSRIFVDAQSRLWVRAYLSRDATPAPHWLPDTLATWTVYDPGGGVAARVTLPSDLTLYDAQDSLIIGTRFVAGDSIVLYAYRAPLTPR